MKEVVLCLLILIVLIVHGGVSQKIPFGCSKCDNSTCESATFECQSDMGTGTGIHCIYDIDWPKVKRIKFDRKTCRHNENFGSINLAKFQNLRQLDMSHLELKSIETKNDIITRGLRKLNASHNYLQTIPSGLFANTPKLDSIDFSSNEIATLENEVFASLPKLKMLNLKENPLKTFNFNIFLPSLTSIALYLPSDSIETLDVSCKQSTVCLFNSIENGYEFKNIRNFIASGNQFGNISDIFSRLSRGLTTLNLSKSFIATLSNQMLEKFNELRHLKWTHSNISQIESDAFRFQTKLQSLDLSYNHLKEVQSSFSRGFSELATLNLVGNQLAKIDYINRKSYPHLNRLIVSKNKFSCDYLEKYKQKWQSDENFHLDHNDNCNGKGKEMSVEKSSPTNEWQPWYVITIIVLLFFILVGIVVVVIDYFIRRKSMPNNEYEQRGAINGFIDSSTIYSGTVYSEAFALDHIYSGIAESNFARENHQYTVPVGEYTNILHAQPMPETMAQPYAVSDIIHAKHTSD